MRVRWRDTQMSPRKWLRAAAVVLASFAAVYVVARPVVNAYLVSHPRRYPDELVLTEPGLSVERVLFSSDGLELVGWFVAATEGDGATIVISHGSGATGPSAYPRAAFLSRAGYHVFVFDHRAHGQSAGSFTTLGPLEVRDMLGAVDYVRTRPDVNPDRVAVMGCSMGSAVSLGAAAADPAIRGVIAESVYADLGELWNRFGYVSVRGTRIHWSWGPGLRLATWLWTGEWVAAFKPVALVGRIQPRPVLIIHGEHDNAACTVADAHRLYQAAGEPRDLWIVSGAGHCDAHYYAQQQYEQRVLDFMRVALAE